MITALVGGQYGSEGKGLIAGHIARNYEAHVRVGAANAGHTLYDMNEEKQVVQQLPCAAYANPRATCCVGAGAVVSLDIFFRELEENAAWRKRHSLPPLVAKLDYRAHVITKRMVEAEAATDLADRIGSTSTIAREGIGTTQAAKVMRSKHAKQVHQLSEDELRRLDVLGVEVTDVSDFLHGMRGTEAWCPILLEGTQGTGLSNTHGDFPYCTSRDTTAGSLAAECGIGPRDVTEVIMVCRTYPIRVAGNSGPFYPDSEELSFADIGVEPEKTTVTKLERRVATFSLTQVVEAVKLNSASSIALTFADYVAPKLAGKTKWDLTEDPSMVKLRKLIEDIERKTGVPVVYLGTGPNSVIERY